MWFRKKIGYLGWLGANYGSCLQAFALYHRMRALGYTVEIIGAGRFVSCRQPPESLKETHPKKYDHERTRCTFVRFMKNHFDFSAALGELPAHGVISAAQRSLLKRYSAVVCGSDQIWKPGGFWFTAQQYLQFAPAEKRVSYAPSVGWNQIPKAYQSNCELWRDWLSSIPYLSCREATGARLISEATGRHVEHVVDPTMLLTPKEWLEQMTDPEYSDEIRGIVDSGRPYMLAYLLDTAELYGLFVEKLAAHLNLEIVWLTGRDNTGPVQRNAADTNPAAFISLINGASFVCADGFHGCCLSLNFGRDFLYLSKNRNFEKQNDSRLQNLFSRFAVEGRVVTPDMLSRLKGKDGEFDFSVFSPIDHGQSQMLIAQGREESVAYLAGALEAATRSKGPLYRQYRENLALIPPRKPAIMRIRRLVSALTPEFFCDKAVWESHVIRGCPALIPVKESNPAQLFAYAPLGCVLERGEYYRLTVCFRIKTAATALYLHVYSHELGIWQVVRRVPCHANSDDSIWQTADIEFIADRNGYDSFMIGASQVSGPGRYFAVKSIELAGIRR
ncbi:MAG: polysaccharide pyruvyl transferase family protein [Succinivibrionaceae bacterium]|nr:polysaccharide pyruvyl transferase family protein [Succinivibrionaceae bacterium]